MCSPADRPFKLQQQCGAGRFKCRQFVTNTHQQPAVTSLTAGCWVAAQNAGDGLVSPTALSSLLSSPIYFTAGWSGHRVLNMLVMAHSETQYMPLSVSSSLSYVLRKAFFEFSMAS